jgi:hypothetical protein
LKNFANVQAGLKLLSTNNALSDLGAMDEGDEDNDSDFLVRSSQKRRGKQIEG